MDKARGSLGLALETLHEFRVGAKFLEHHLDGDGAVQHFVAAHINAAHATTPKLTLEQEIPRLTKDTRSWN